MIVGKFNFIFKENIKAEQYSCKDYFGVIFTTEDGTKYDVVCNPNFGDRLIINSGYGMSRDIPFKESTFGFLPDGIIISLVENK